MGIKFLSSYLNKNDDLKHKDYFHESFKSNYETKIIVWDCLGWMRRLYKFHSRSSKILFDFREMNHEIQRILDSFKFFGFKLIAFIDGYHCTNKIPEKRRRRKDTLKNIRKNIQLFKQINTNNINNTNNTHNIDNQKLQKKIDFIVSSGYTHYLEQTLTNNGCIVYRGSGKCDIDKDIAQFVYQNQHKIYGILSVDTDYFGFYDLPQHIKLIYEFHIKCKKRKKSLSLDYYYSSQIWNKLRLHNNIDRLKLICLCGNDFIRKKPKLKILKRCAGNTKQTQHGTEHTGHNFDDEANKESSDITTENSNNKIESVSEDQEQVNSANNAKSSKKKQQAHITEIVANSIVNDTVQPEIVVSDMIKNFYSIAKSEKQSYIDNINVTWNELKDYCTFHGGFFFHDIDAVGFTIHEKLSNIRHAIIAKNLNLKCLKEFIPSMNEKYVVNVLDCKSINLNEINHKKCDLDIKLSESPSYNSANLCFVFEQSLKILQDRKWINETQYNALKLQFEVRYYIKTKWCFSIEYRQFRYSGFPHVEDLTAQWLYMELSRLLCLNPCNIFPNIYRLFDGPLYHFFCFIQRENNDKNGIIKQLKNTLKKYKNKLIDDKKYDNYKSKSNIHYDESKSVRCKKRSRHESYNDCELNNQLRQHLLNKMNELNNRQMINNAHVLNQNINNVLYSNLNPIYLNPMLMSQNINGMILGMNGLNGMNMNQMHMLNGMNEVNILNRINPISMFPPLKRRKVDSNKTKDVNSFQR